MSILDMNGVEVKIDSTIRHIPSDDLGTVCGIDTDDGKIWADWESGDRSYVTQYSETWEVVQILDVSKELTLQKAIDFIMNSGYNVTLSKI
ncbi:MAG TPA: hypothetical protein VFM18_22650 [Methanosarcina sp.]|nr:hypothetical protein [Methanosarcina sp.]